MRKVEVDVETLYSLISCAEDYGFREVVPDLIQMMNGMNKFEIDQYARKVSKQKGYTEEDYFAIKEALEQYL